MATLALGAIGATLGSVFGGPAGFKLGLSIGSTLGGLVEASMNHPVGSGKLTDLRVSSSSYGTPIPMVWGKARLPGMVIWVAVDKYGNHLIQHAHNSGGGSGPSQKTYTYTTTVAVALCRGTTLTVDGTLVHRNIVLDRVWADDLIIWEASQAIHVFDDNYHVDLTFYDGSETQARDSTINSERTNSTTPDEAPAYRGTCYFIIKDLDLTPFNQRMPNFSAEIHTEDVTVADIVGDVLGECGVHASDYDGSDGAIDVSGMPIADQRSGQDIIAPLLDHYMVSMVEVDGQIRLVPRGKSPVLTINEDDLGASMDTFSGDSIPVKFEEHRLQATDLPGRVNVTFYSSDPSKHYEQSTQGDVRQTGNVKNQVSITLPLTLSEDEGRKYAARHLDTAWLEQDQYSFSLMPRCINLAPGDTVLKVIGPTTRKLRILTMEFGAFSEIRITATPEGGDVDTFTQTIPAAYSPPGSGSYSGSVNTVGVVPTDFMLYSGTELRDGDQSKAGFYIGGTGGSGWSGASIYWSPDGGTSYNLDSQTISTRATLGSATSVLADGTTAGTLDTVSTVDVGLIDSGGLTSTSDSLVLTGTNNAVVGKEILGFSTATLTNPSAYTLSRLVRGQRASVMTGHTSGELFMLATGNLIRITVPDALVGATIYVKCVSPGQTVADVTAQTVIIAPRTPTALETTVAGIVAGSTTGPAGGVLSGTYPDPGFAVDMATQAELDAAVLLLQPISEKGAISGYASLDSGGKVPTSQLPSSVLGSVNYQGVWNASTNSPALSSGTGTKGFYYKVSVAGTTTLDGVSEWNVGDMVVFDGVTWDKIDNTEEDATTTLKGRIQLAGDLAGTASSPSLTVLGAGGTVGDATHSIALTYDTKGRITASAPVSIQIVESQVTNLTADLAAKAPLASPTFTGTPVAPTATAGTNTTQIATTAFVTAAVSAGSGGGGGTTLARSTVSQTTTSLANNAVDSTSRLPTGKSGVLYLISTNVAARVRLYQTASQRTADLSRAIGVPASAGSVPIAEIVTSSGNLSILLNAPPNFINFESAPVSNLPMTVQNLSGSTATVTVTATIMQFEA